MVILGRLTSHILDWFYYRREFKKLRAMGLIDTIPPPRKGRY